MNVPFARRSVFVALASILLEGAALCQCPAMSAGGTGWASGTPVLIYINDSDGSFSSAEQTAISAAFSNWNSTEGAGLSLSTEVENSLAWLPSSGYALVEVGTTTCGVGKSACTTCLKGTA
jgi:hypothetical protein